MDQVKMEVLTLLGFAGFALVTLTLSVWLGALREPVNRSEFYLAHRAFEKSIDDISPVLSLAKAMAKDNE